MKRFSTNFKPSNPITDYLKGVKNTFLLCCSILLVSLNAFAAATTTAVSSITATSAVSGGTCSSTVTNDWITEVGIVWGTATGPTVALATKTSTTYAYGTQYYPLTFNGQNMTGLTCGTTYYVRAYVRSGPGAGTVEYGNERSFTTSSCGPFAITTTVASAVTATTASSGGSITPTGAVTVTTKGVVWGTSASPTLPSTNKTIDGSGSATYTSSITGLTSSTTYYVRAYVIGSDGNTYYGSDQTFTTLFQVSGTVSPFSLTPDWYFGNQMRYTFPSGSFPAVPPGPTVSSNSANNSSVETSTSVSFRSGAVATYTSSMQAWNSAGTQLRNFISDNTCAGSSTGGAVSFPDPARDATNDAFYMILGNDTTGGLCAAGKGASDYRVSGTSSLITTITAKPASPFEINTFATEAITAGTDGDGGYWVVIHDIKATNRFRVWHYTAAGKGAPVDYVPVTTATIGSTTTAGYLKFSPCMNMIAFGGFSNNEIVVYNFNRKTGAVGTQIARKAVSNETSGLEFSPDGTKIYYNGQGGVVKWFSIAAPATGGTVAGSPVSWTIQMGPDAQIYTSGNGGTGLGVVTNANSASPGFTGITPAAGTATFRGLINLAWLSPQKVKITATNTSGCNGYFFKYDFKNYFNDKVTAVKVEWDFNNDGTIDVTKMGASLADTVLYYYPKLAGTTNYQAKVIVTDAYCNQLWKDSVTVSPNCPLPVNFVRVSAAKYDNDKVKVIWITAQEKNNDHFEIQRSTDNQNYSTIGVVKGNGTTSSTQTYSYVDNNPVNGPGYYRIVQVDTDNSSMSSEVATVSLSKTSVLVAPNPFREDIVVSVDGIESKATVNVYDATGRLVLQNAIEAGASFTRFGAGLEKGTYIIEVIGLDVNVHQKVIKE